MITQIICASICVKKTEREMKSSLRENVNIPIY